MAVILARIHGKMSSAGVGQSGRHVGQWQRDAGGGDG